MGLITFKPYIDGSITMRRNSQRTRSSGKEFGKNFVPSLQKLEDRTTTSSWTLDPTFGGDGIVTTSFGTSTDDSYRMVIDANGRTILVGYTRDGANGDFALARYNSDGSLDTTFGGDGKVTTDFANTDDTGYGVAIDGAGRIIVVGTSGNLVSGDTYDAAVARYNSDGSLDTSFGDDGKVTTHFLGGDLFMGVAVDAFGRIVASGRTHDSSDKINVARYNVDGSLDSTFGIDGKVITAIGSQAQSLDLKIDQDGKIVVVGGTGPDTTQDFAVVRYNIDGSLDTSFDDDGIVTIDFGRRDFAERLAIDSNGRIVVAGFTEAIDPNRDFALARLLPNGDLDPTFDGDGRVITPFGSGRDDCQAVALETNGKIVIAGISFSGASLDFALARYNLDGSLDTTFDDDGKLTTTISSGDDYATGVAVDGGGRIVVGGISQFGPSSDFVVARYFDRDRPPISISDAPAVVEGDAGSAASAVFTVTLSAASTQTITVHYATADGTAIAGKDYNATSGDLSFAPGETSKQIVVAIRGERLDEGDESFFVKLSNPTNAAIVRGTGVGTIQDDDTSLFVITHGLQPDRKYPFWVTDMAAAINGRLGY